MLAFTNLTGQCADHDCNPAFNGIQFTSNCIAVGTTTELQVVWTMSGVDEFCLAPAGSWRIQISMPVTGQYGVADALTVDGDGFTWTYDATNYTLNGLSNVDMDWLESDTVFVTTTGYFDNGCVLTQSNANIFITPSIQGGCPQAFNNITSDDNVDASLGIDLPDVTTPVDLVAFTAKRQEQTSLLEWTTRVEVNNKGFDIQRSEDGSIFETIGFVDAQEPTAFESHYSFVKIQVENLKANKIEKIYLTDDANKLVKTITVDATQDVHRYDLSDLTSGIYYLRFVGGNNVVTEKLIKLSF